MGYDNLDIKKGGWGFLFFLPFFCFIGKCF